MKLILPVVCALAFGSVDFSAQNQPDFSGTWLMDPARSEAAAQGAPIGPVTVAIRQTPVEVRIETTRNGRTDAVRYLPSSAQPTGGGDMVGAFRWDGPKLVTRLVTDINKQASRSKGFAA